MITNHSYSGFRSQYCMQVLKKLHFTVGLSILTCAASLAQSFTIEPNPASASANLNVNPGLLQILANSIIYNQTDENLQLKWERIVNDKPECWSSSVDTPNFQSFPGVDELEFTLLPNLPDGGDLIVHMYIEGFSGEGQVVLRVSNLSVPSDTVLVTYSFTATGNNPCDAMSIAEVTSSEMQLYPNPCTNAFHITDSGQLLLIAVYDLYGRKVKQFSNESSNLFNIESLPQGMYLVEISNSRKTVIQTSKLIKD